MALLHCLLLFFIGLDLDGRSSSLFRDLLPPLDVLEDLRECNWVVQELLDFLRGCPELPGGHDVSILAVLVERIQLDIHALKNFIFGLQLSGIMDSGEDGGYVQSAHLLRGQLPYFPE